MGLLRNVLTLALFFCVDNIHAQSALPTPRSDMVVFDQAANHGKVAPGDMLRKFFAGVKAGKLDDAFNELSKNSLLAQKPEDIENLKKGMQQAVDKYGNIQGFEIIEKKAAGENLLRLTCISLGEDMPLRWRFYFYKVQDAWRLLDMRVDSGIADLFEDLGRGTQ